MKKGWEIKKLGDVCNILNGGTPKTGFKEYWDGNVKWITPKDMGKLTGKFVDDTPRKISFLGLQKSSAKLIPSNSLILSTRAPIGHIAINTSEMATNQGCRGIVPLKGTNTQYLYYFLSNSIDLLNSLGAGATFKELSTKALSSVKIPFPSHPEQKRIVGILDKAFAAISTAKANAEKNLQNARELFESYLQGVFANPGDGWEVKKLDEVCIVERGSSPRPIKEYQTKSKDGVNWIKIGDTKNVEKYIYSTKEKITKEGAEKSRFVKESDLILSNSMSFGRPFIMKTDGYIHDGWFVLRLKNHLDSEFFYYLLSSPLVQNQFRYLASGAIVKNISSDLTKKAVLPIPPFPEQQSIVRKINQLSSETKKLKAIYQQKIADLDELKKSVLKKAFNGELPEVKI